MGVFEYFHSATTTIEHISVKHILAPTCLSTEDLAQLA